MHRITRCAVLVFKRVNLSATVSNAKGVVRHYSLKKRGGAGSAQDAVQTASEEILNSRTQFKIPPEGVPIFTVKSVGIYKLISLAAVAQFSSAVILAPILMRNESQVANQRTKNTLAMVLIAWGVVLMLVNKKFVNKNILSLVLTPGPNLRMETVNLIGQLKYRTIPVTKVERILTADAAKKVQFAKVKIDGETYFMDKNGEVHDEELFYEVVVGHGLENIEEETQ